MLDQTIIYIAFLIFASLVLLLIALVISYIWLINKYLELKKGGKKEVDPEEILSKARQKSREILEEANIEAKNIISRAEKFLEDYQEELGEEIRKANDIYAKVYRESLNSIQQESYAMLKNIPNELKVFMVSAIDGFRATLAKEVQDAQQKILKSLEDSVVSAQHEIEKYKEARKRQIDENAVEYIAELTKRVLSKEISLEEHEKLVLKALEEAKKQDVF